MLAVVLFRLDHRAYVLEKLSRSVHPSAAEFDCIICCFRLGQIQLVSEEGKGGRIALWTGPRPITARWPLARFTAARPPGSGGVGTGLGR